MLVIKTTNNRMEMMAAIIGLEALIKPCNVALYSDSQYLVKAFNEKWIAGWIRKGWKTSNNKPVKISTCGNDFLKLWSHIMLLIFGSRVIVVTQ